MFSYKTHLRIRHNAYAYKNVSSVKSVTLPLSDKQSGPSRYSQQIQAGETEGEKSGLRFPETLDFRELRF